MYTAGRQGGDQFCFLHVPGMHAESELRPGWAGVGRPSDLPALLHASLPTHLQPGRGQGLRGEALRRVPDDGSVQSGLTHRGRRVQRAIRHGADDRSPARRRGYHSAGRDRRSRSTLSPAELNDPTLITFARQAGLIELLPRLLIEVTENILLEPRSTGMQTLSILRSLGARLALDDYGTGFSNMQTLEQLQPHLPRSTDRSPRLRPEVIRAGGPSSPRLGRSPSRWVRRCCPEGVETNTSEHRGGTGDPLGQGLPPGPGRAAGDLPISCPRRAGGGF